MRFICNILIVAVFLTSQSPVSGQCPDAGELSGFISSKPGNNDEYLQRLFQYELALRDCNLAADSLHGLLFYSIAVDLGKRKKYREGIQYCNKALASFRNTSSNAVSVINHTADVFYIIQAFYDSLGLKSLHMLAIDSCIQIEKIAQAAYKYSPKLISRKVFWLFTKGDYSQTIKVADYGESLIRRQRLPGDTLKRLASLLAYKAQSLLALGRLDEAEEIIKSRLWPYVISGVPEYVGLVHGISAELYNRKSNSKLEARENWNSFYLNKANKFRKGCAESLISIAAMYMKNGLRRTEVENHLIEAFAYADRVDSVRILNLLANLNIANNRFSEGFRFFDMAFQLLGSGTSEEDIINLTIDQTVTTHLNIYLSYLIIDKADAVLKKYKASHQKEYLTKAIGICRSADAFLTRIKDGIIEVESNLSWRRSSRKLYEIAIESSYLLGDLDAAFYFFEKSRAVLLDDKIERERGMSIEELISNGSLNLTESQLNSQLTAFSSGSQEYLNIQEKIYSIQKEREQLIGKINERRSSLGFVPIHTIRLAQEKLLVNHEGLIEIFSGDTSIYILKILKSGSELIRLNASEFASLSNSFNQSLRKPSLFIQEQDASSRIANSLYKSIFQSLQIPSGRLIISPDGYYFPFEALVIGFNGKKPEYFLERYAVSYTYSARYLSNYNFDVSKSDFNNFMGMAPVYFSKRYTLNALEGSDVSLGSIGKQFNRPNTFVNAAATRATFLNNFYKYKIIHLYAHASAGGSDLNPVLYFADSALFLEDIYSVERPKTSMIVLAACETGVGKLYAGEGVFSFNRAFAAIGIPTAVVNLWPVDNIATYRISELFYANVAMGMDIDIALQHAKLKYLKGATTEKKLPFYWAAGVVTGRSANILAPEKSFDYRPYVIGAMVFGGIASLIIWFRGRSKRLKIFQLLRSSY